MTFIRGGSSSGGGTSANNFIRSIPMLTENGFSGGDFDMRVNGSLIAPRDFYTDISTFSSVADVVYLTKISIILGGQDTETIERYGTIAALTNGTDIFQEKNAMRSNLFFPALMKRNVDFFTARMSIKSSLIYGGSQRAILWEYDFTSDNKFGIPYLPSDIPRVGVTIKDNLTALVFHQGYATLEYEPI